MDNGSAISALESTLRVLWPDSVAVRRAGRERTAEGAAQSFVVVPNARAPRLLVPAESPAAAAGAMQRFSAALVPRETASRIVAGGLLRVGGARLMPDRMEVLGGHSTSVQQYLTDVLGTEVLVSLGIGNERANRKPVLQVFDRGGRTLAFAKIADAPHVEPHLNSEISALTALSVHRLPSSIEPPRLLHSGRWNGRLVMIISALDTSPLQRPGEWLVPHEAMRAFARAFDEGEQRLVDTPLWFRMREAERRLESPERRHRFGAALNRLAERAAEDTFRIGAWHGDWTPWNMSRRGKRIQLWDWERFQTGVPFGLDARHFIVNTFCRRHGLSTSIVHAGLERLGNRCPGETSHVLDAVYLAAISGRYLTSAQEEMGQAIERRALVMLEALEEKVGLR